MKSELLKKYETELEYLYQGLGAFERARPRQAEVLRIAGGRSDDPEIRRLLDGVALLSARLALQDDQQVPKLVRDLMRTMAPEMLIGLPSFCSVQMVSNPEDPQSAFEIKKGETITFESRQGGLCRYSVAQGSTLHPLKISRSRAYNAPFDFDIPQDFHGAQSVLEIEVESQDGETPFSEMLPAELDLYLVSGQTRNMPLLGAIWSDVAFIAVYDSEDRLLDILPEHALLPRMNDEGFVISDTLVSGTSQPDLLRDIIAYPAKESFLKLTGLAPALSRCEGTSFRARVMFSKLDQSALNAFQPSDVQTHVIPMINCFRCETDPVEYSFERESVAIIPTAKDLTDLKQLRVEEVMMILPDRELTLPEFCRQTYFSRSGLPTWQEQVELGSLDDRLASLSFSLNEVQQTSLPELEGINLLENFRFFARSLCSNGEHAAQVPLQAEANFDPEYDVPGQFRVFTEPTAAVLPPQSIDEHWPFLAIVSHNMNSIFDAPDATKALKEAILLSAPDRGHQFADAIRTVSLTRTVAQVPINKRFLLSSGTRVDISIGKGQLPVSDHGFAAALAAYLRQFCSFDRFLDVAVRHEGAIEPFIVFDRIHGVQQCA